MIPFHAIWGLCWYKFLSAGALQQKQENSYQASIQLLHQSHMQSKNLDKPQSDLPATPKGPKGVKGPNHVQPTETSEGKVSKAMKCSSVT